MNSLTSFSASQRFRVSLIVLLSFIPLLAPLVFLQSGSFFKYQTKVDDQIGEIEVEEVDRAENAINIWFQAVDFNPETQKAKFNVYPWPSEDLTTTSFASSTITKVPFSLFIDELNGKGRYDFEENQIVGSMSAEFDVLSYLNDDRARDTFYPMDKYTLDAYADVSLIKSDGSLEPIRTFDLFYTNNSLSGFSVSFTRVAAYDNYLNDSMFDEQSIIRERDEGKISFLTIFERNEAVKITVLILSLFMLIASATLAWISLRIFSGKRPPSMQALIWSAASVLATVQLREMFPGNPRLGIGLDFVVFFPSLLASMLFGLLLTVMWIGRDDYHI
jgi:hypothetical protein